MLYHKSCMTTAYLDVSKGMRLVSYPGINKGLSISSLELIQITKEIKPAFICLECNKDIPLEELVGICGICGNTFPVVELFTASDCGGIYCERDILELCPPESGTRITSFKTVVVSNIKLKGER